MQAGAETPGAETARAPHTRQTAWTLTPGLLHAGFGGAVGMVRNWTYTLLFIAGELWGDVVLSLLFWGLANELTHMAEAPTLYPLFGMGANLGQTVAGRALSVFSVSTRHTLSHTRQLQASARPDSTVPGSRGMHMRASSKQRHPAQQPPAQLQPPRGRATAGAGCVPSEAGQRPTAAHCRCSWEW